MLASWNWAWQNTPGTRGWSRLLCYCNCLLELSLAKERTPPLVAHANRQNQKRKSAKTMAIFASVRHYGMNSQVAWNKISFLGTMKWVKSNKLREKKKEERTPPLVVSAHCFSPTYGVPRRLIFYEMCDKLRRWEQLALETLVKYKCYKKSLSWFCKNL